MTALVDGVHQVARGDYDRLERVNWSTLKHLGKSPAHYRHQLLERDSGDTDAKRRGRCAHLAVFEPEKFRATCVVWDGGTRRGKEWEAFKARNAGSEILTEDMHAEVMALSKAAKSSAMAAPYLAGGVGESTVLWRVVAPAIGALPGWAIDCKGRLDFIANVGAIVDLKTTRDASPSGFSRECARYEYHGQAAFYRDGYEAATGKRLPYILVAVEVAPPHVVQVYRLPDEVMALGRDRYRTLLDRLVLCRQLSEWPGYGETEMDLTLPRWAAPNDEDDVDALDLVING